MDTSTDIADALDRDLAALKAGAADYEARHRVLDTITWPGGARIAVNFTADFDAMLLRRVLNEPPMQLAKGEFGGRVGIWLDKALDWDEMEDLIVRSYRLIAPRRLRGGVRAGD